MRYMKTKWVHDFPDQPVFIYEEIDEENFECRKVEIYSNGSASFAGIGMEVGGSFLSDVEVPDASTINEDDEFVAEVIGVEEFERMWSYATRSNLS